MTEPGLGLRPLRALPMAARRGVRVLLTDIDGTITDGARVPAAAYGALEALRAAGLIVIPVTGRPAGWCDMIARSWPVDGVVGENGALWFRYHPRRRRMERYYWLNEAERAAARRKLARLERKILNAVPSAALAADQPYRENDLAIDIGEDVCPLGPKAVARILALFEQAGARAKLSSIHVNGWFGDFDKLAMTRRLLAEGFGIDADEEPDKILFVGDSPNDAPMFAHFPLSVGVANIRAFAGRLEAEPAFVTRGSGAAGFAELARALLVAWRARRS
jgi:HAD superfamily hydrolase (TIGR01484 family)